MAVDPDVRRQRVGTTLLAAIEADAAENGAANMYLTPEDDAARAFFVANEYQVDPSLDGTPDEGWLLSKPLPPPAPAA